jgi:hypothetical protein
MMRSLIWIEGEAKGWACSNCAWKFPVPTLLTGEEAKEAYHRLAGVKFREHECKGEGSSAVTITESKRESDTTFGERARALIKRGYTPKVAVELVMHDAEIEYGNDPKKMARVRADAEDFLMRARKGLI